MQTKPRKIEFVGRFNGNYGELGRYIDFNQPAPRPPQYNHLVIKLQDVGDFLRSEVGPDKGIDHLGSEKRKTRFFLGEAGAKLETSNPWYRMGRAVVWFTATWRMVPCFEKFHFGAICQRFLTEALLGFSTKDREFVYNGFDVFEGLKLQEWHSQFYGAMAVARVAKCLKDLGITPALPTPEVDTLYKIDLFGRSSPPQGVLISLQVANTKIGVNSYIERLDAAAESASQDEPSSRRYLKYAKSRRGVHQFMEDQRLTCLPVFIHVGAQGFGIRPWQYDKPSSTLPIVLASLKTLL